MTEHYTIKELADSKGTSAPVRAALLALEARVLELEDQQEKAQVALDRCRTAMAVMDNTSATLECENESYRLALAEQLEVRQRLERKIGVMRATFRVNALRHGFSEDELNAALKEVRTWT